METSEDYLVSEIEKTKRKLREISTVLETQQQFLRLIVQVNYNSLYPMVTCVKAKYLHF